PLRLRYATITTPWRAIEGTVTNPTRASFFPPLHKIETCPARAVKGPNHRPSPLFLHTKLTTNPGIKSERGQDAALAFSPAHHHHPSSFDTPPQGEAPQTSLPQTPCLRERNQRPASPFFLAPSNNTSQSHPLSLSLSIPSSPL
ncbi:unnamed protein product, partial [Ectocarpus sp. 12 AP-2014]